MAGAISQPRQSCQFLFCLMKIHCCTGPLGRRAVGRQAKGFLWRRSVELRASGAVGLRWKDAFGSRSTRRAGARGGPRVGSNHKNGNSVTVARNRTQRQAMTMPAPYATRGVSGALFILVQRKAKAIQTIGIAKSHKAILSRVCRYLETW